MSIAVDDITVNLIWLRDNCRCNDCYNWDTHQRKLNDIEMDNANVENISVTGNQVLVTWTDKHASKYDINWIKTQHRVEITPEPILWDGNEIKESLPIVQDDGTEESVKLLVECILKFGIGIIRNIPTTLEATETLATRIAPVMHTNYGGMWYVDTVGFDQYQDTAYTNQELAAHTDNTYFIEPAGLQVFHCLERAEQGGETVLVDGFKAAHSLKAENQRYYECLRTTNVEWQYVSEKFRQMFTKPVLNAGVGGERLEQIRYNIYDRSPRVLCTSDQQNTFYRSLRYFRNIVHRPEMQWKLSLDPGYVLFINNWRVLHGRKEFRGRRRLVGCYLGMNTFLSAARKLKLIR